MSVSLQSVGAITLFVDDPKRSKAFYERVFDGKVVNEDDESAAFRLENTIVNLLVRSAAPSLIDPAPVASADAGASFQLTIWVEDADETCADLARRGVRLLNGPLDREWGVRTACFADPDGHVWEVAGPLPGQGGAS